MTTSLQRRGLLAAFAFAATACSFGAAAQEAFPIPGKPVTLILPAIGGSTGDRVLRMFAERLKEDWKVPVIVDAKPGAAGVVGTVHAVNAAPDGHTILLGYSHLRRPTPSTRSGPTTRSKIWSPWRASATSPCSTSRPTCP